MSLPLSFLYDLGVKAAEAYILPRKVTKKTRTLPYTTRRDKKKANEEMEEGSPASQHLPHNYGRRLNRSENSG